MKPLTATRSMRFVVARYSVRRIVLFVSFRPCGSSSCFTSAWTGLSSSLLTPFCTDGEGEAKQKVRRTRGDSSASTCSARRAEEARRWVGSAMSIVLRRCQGSVEARGTCRRGERYNAQGKSSADIAVGGDGVDDGASIGRTTTTSCRKLTFQKTQSCCALLLLASLDIEASNVVYCRGSLRFRAVGFGGRWWYFEVKSWRYAKGRAQPRSNRLR